MARFWNLVLCFSRNFGVSVSCICDFTAGRSVSFPGTSPSLKHIPTFTSKRCLLTLYDRCQLLRMLHLHLNFLLLTWQFSFLSQKCLFSASCSIICASIEKLKQYSRYLNLVSYCSFMIPLITGTSSLSIARVNPILILKYFQQI